MDNFAVGAAYGCRGRRVLHVSNWLIACSNAGTTWATMFVGAQILRIVSVEAASNIGYEANCCMLPLLHRQPLPIIPTLVY
jgi:putative Mn2+ efflux pump MntP